MTDTAAPPAETAAPDVTWEAVKSPMQELRERAMEAMEAKTPLQQHQAKLDQLPPRTKVRLTSDHCWLELNPIQIKGKDKVQRLHAAVDVAKAETFERVEQAYQAALRESGACQLYQAAVDEQKELRREADQTSAHVEELTARKRRLLASDGSSIAAQLTTTNRLLADATAKDRGVRERLSALTEAITVRKQAADADVDNTISRAILAERHRFWQETREAFGQLIGQRPGSGAEALARIVAIECGTRVAIEQAEERLRERWRPRRKKEKAAPQDHSGELPTIGEVTRVAGQEPAPVG